MGSGIFFPICALPFSILIIILFFKKGHINTIETKIYEFLIVTNFFGLILEISCTFASMIYNEFPMVSNLIFKSYLVYLISWTSMFTIYIYNISTNSNKRTYKPLFLLLFILTIIITYYLPIQLVVENNFQVRYTVGKSVDFSYLVSGILIFIIILILFKNRKKILTKKYIPVFTFLIVGMISVIVQNIFPQLLVLTYVETLICVIMYFTIENPDVKLLEEVHKSKEISDNANEEKTMFLYNISQEIRTSTDIVDDYANLILESDDSEEIKDSARNIKAETSKFNSLMNEIFDVSKLDASNIKVYNNKYNVKNIFKEIVSIYTKKCESKALSFRVNIDHGIPELLYGDSINLKKALMIILDNSLEYTNDGYVEFNVNTIIKNDVCRLLISIEDSGKGIKGEDINELKLNDKSFSEANKLITLMSGAINVSSNYGYGTKVKIILDQKIEIDHNEEVVKYEELFDNVKLLMVDDSEAGIKIIDKIIRGTNIQMEFSMNGKDCMNKLKTEHYDLILLDEQLTQISAVELMKKVLSIKNFSTPVILLTKDNSYEYNEEYKKLGFNDYLLKPVKKKELLDKVSNFVKKDK